MPDRLMYFFLIFKRYGYLTITRFKNSNLSQKAAQLTLSSLLAAVPIITIIVGILSFTPALESMQTQLFKLIEQHLAPGSSDIMMPYLIKFSAQTKNLPVAGLIALFVTALLLLNSFEKQCSINLGNQESPKNQRKTAHLLGHSHIRPHYFCLIVKPIRHTYIHANIWDTNKCLA